MLSCMKRVSSKLPVTLGQNMRLTTATVIALFAAMFTAPIMCEEARITLLDLEALDIELPPALRLRVEMDALQRPELLESNKQAGLERLGADDYRESLARWARVYRAWDGVVFLADDLHMALWVRDNKGWKCVVPRVRVDKTFGGAFPGMPVRYLGEGLFAVSETVPGAVTEKSKNGFPQARAVTFLIDSKDCKVKERSRSFVYDHNPPIVVPKEWATRYKIKSE